MDVDQNYQEQMESAAQAARKRRELRRQRIMANPDQRMRKLAGYNDKHAGNSDSSGASSEVKLRPLSNYLPEMPDIQPSSEPVVVTAAPQVRAEETLKRVSSIKQRPLHVIDTRSDVTNASSVNPYDSVMHSQDGPNDAFKAQSDSVLTRNNLEQTSSIRDQKLHDTYELTAAEEKEKLQAFIRKRYFLCFVLGILIRLSFMSSYGEQYVQSIINPFVAFEVAVFGYQRGVGMNLSTLMPGGMWVSILMLCGVKRELLNTYKTIMAVITSITDDFVIYFFAFAMIHIVI